VGDRALTPPTRRSLGGLLPRQQADRKQAHSPATDLATNLYSCEAMTY
jgi:hypothetical protein